MAESKKKIAAEPKIEVVQAQRPDLVNKLVLTVIGIIALIIVVALLSNLDLGPKSNPVETPAKSLKPTQQLAANNGLTVTEIKADQIKVNDKDGKNRTFVITQQTTYTKGGPPPQVASRSDIKTGSKISLTAAGSTTTSIHIVSQ